MKATEQSKDEFIPENKVRNALGASGGAGPRRPTQRLLIRDAAQPNESDKTHQTVVCHKPSLGDTKHHEVADLVQIANDGTSCGQTIRTNEINSSSSRWMCHTLRPNTPRLLHSCLFLDTSKSTTHPASDGCPTLARETPNFTSSSTQHCWVQTPVQPLPSRPRRLAAPGRHRIPLCSSSSGLVHAGRVPGHINGLTCQTHSGAFSGAGDTSTWPSSTC